MNKRISVICVTRNAEEYLERCLLSIFAQKHKDIEVIIIDGASTDGTIGILRKWHEKISFWQSEPDEGLYDAMNKALNYITGQWVYFLGADDVLLPGFSDFVEKELNNPFTIYYANVYFKGDKHKGPLSDYARVKNGGIFHQSMIYPVSVFKEYNYRYNLKYKIAADVALNLEINGNKDFIFYYRDYTIAIFNESGVSTKFRDSNFYKDLPNIILKNFGVLIWLRFQLRNFKYWITNSKEDHRLEI